MSSLTPQILASLLSLAITRAGLGPDIAAQSSSIAAVLVELFRQFFSGETIADLRAAPLPEDESTVAAILAEDQATPPGASTHLFGTTLPPEKTP
jgi:hypothetical protein